ncbi:hypothetical protein SDC9_115777 [bioreactor metagenome]|uniref:Uncharacterized protein n=1 Tax=bioreactor metagenome TaxID=1076179 RepID=A0A645BUB5_9ZZZZ
MSCLTASDSKYISLLDMMKSLFPNSERIGFLFVLNDIYNIEMLTGYCKIIKNEK